MTLTLDVETWFKVTAYPLSKGSLSVKYEPDYTKGREDMLQRRDLEWTEGRTEWSL